MILKGQTKPENTYKEIARKAFNKRVAAEWEQKSYLVLVWKNYPEVLAKIAHYAQDEAKVIILCKDSQIVKKYFHRHLYQTRNLIFRDANFDTPWVRDYSPANLYLKGSSNLIFVDWLYNRLRKADDLFPMQLAQFMRKPLLQLSISDSGVVQIGGNFMTNGLCTAFSSNLLLSENKRLTEDSLKLYFQHFLGIKNYILLDTLPYDIIHHIDMHLKLINPNTILIGKFPKGVSDQPYILKNRQKIEKDYKTCFNSNYHFVEIPMPDDFGRYPDSSGWADYLTYTNSLLLNKSIFVPVYGNLSDKFALAIYKKNFSGYRIIPINVNAPIMDGGAVHCLTYSVPDDTAFIIWHEDRKYLAQKKNLLPIYATVFYPKRISWLKLFYRFNQYSKYKEVYMTKNDSLNVFSSVLSFPKNKKELNYYFQAAASDGKYRFLPKTAPKGSFRILHHSKQKLILALTDDTILVAKNSYLLKAKYSGIDAQDLLFYWKSEDNLKLKNANKPNTLVLLPKHSDNSVYTFILMISDGEKLYSDTLRIRKK